MRNRKLKAILSFTLILSFKLITAQSFQVPIYFEDAAGQNDTIVVGYDITGSYGIDPALGEIDIRDSAYSKPFEVRAAIYDYYTDWPNLPRIIESKKMIIGYVCFDPTYFDEANSVMLVIKSDHWPVDLSWDNSLFQETCNRLDIVDCTPGGWFDVCGPGHPYQILEIPNSEPVRATYFGTEFQIETDDGTLQALFLRFNRAGSATKDVSHVDMNVIPNPSQSLFQLDYPMSPGDKINITDLMGNPIRFTYQNKVVDLLDAPDGMYLVNVKMNTGQMVSKRILKTVR